jgi:hypothetical protein
MPKTCFLKLIYDPNEMAFFAKAAMGSEPLKQKLTAQQLTNLDAILKEKQG